MKINIKKRITLETATRKGTVGVRTQIGVKFFFFFVEIFDLFLVAVYVLFNGFP